MAGRSLRARSPVMPKMTKATGWWPRGSLRSSGSRRVRSRCSRVTLRYAEGKDEAVARFRNRARCARPSDLSCSRE